jgi:hypothetical protein|tara:strand:- start:1021 stop:1128 length:108 start_codon:yes stop_codon:yes gene_type:complete
MAQDRRLAAADARRRSEHLDHLCRFSKLLLQRAAL